MLDGIESWLPVASFIGDDLWEGLEIEEDEPGVYLPTQEQIQAECAMIQAEKAAQIAAGTYQMRDPLPPAGWDAPRVFKSPQWERATFFQGMEG